MIGPARLKLIPNFIQYIARARMKLVRVPILAVPFQ